MKKCDFNHFNHTILEPGVMMCWDCGKTFGNKNNVMIHRRIEHNVSIVCRNLNTQAGCDRSEDNCGYLHPKSVQQPSQQPPMANLKITNNGELLKEQDFQGATQKKTIPLSVLATPNKMEEMMIEMISSIKDQNKIMMELILNMQRK